MPDPVVVVPVPPPVPVSPPLPVWVLPSFGYCALLIFGIALVASIYIQGDIRTMMFQATIMLTTGCVLYWFQSSSGSAKKDENQAATNTAAISALAVSAPAPVTTTTTTTGDPPTTTTKVEPATEPVHPLPQPSTPPV